MWDAAVYFCKTEYYSSFHQDVSAYAADAPRFALLSAVSFQPVEIFIPGNQPLNIAVCKFAADVCLSVSYSHLVLVMMMPTQ